MLQQMLGGNPCEYLHKLAIILKMISSKLLYADCHFDH